MEWTYLLENGQGVYFDDAKLWAIFQSAHDRFTTGKPLSTDAQIAFRARYASPRAVELLELFEFQVNREVN